MMFLCVPPPELNRPAQNTNRLLLYTPNRWRGRKRITVRFLDGDAEIRRRVAEVATGPESWNSACGLQVEFIDRAPSDIRITFARGGSWSYVGDYCTNVPQDMPTMQLGWLRSDTNPVEVRRVTLHEFGHAYGFHHEHLSPAARIPWNMETVYEYYLRTNGWPRWQVDAQVLTQVDESVSEYSQWDTLSIMHYRVPAEVTTDGVELGGATMLSMIDRVMASVWYGLPPVTWHKAFFPQVMGGRHGSAE